ncbi:hypothetical protein A3H84_02880 [Candidatus Roizmanbacteria bacterium RIFCSPLOWO2_02_FULL_40_13]|nr:MAG: hypothetical protein A3H84_02880 [Candidatus Roizmanbacteria bacterium RIFCSPLOWO2_02_FULL_40_13]
MVSENKLEVLKKDSLQIIFSYSPTGFGHLRVMDALQHGLPIGATSETFGAEDTSLGSLYRLISIYPPLRILYERLQGGWIEKPFTAFYRWMIRTRPFILYLKLKTLINKKKKSVTEILFIATHFALAHKLGAIKEELEKETGVKTTLVVVVTDDSPQQIWYVPEADLITVPSEYTRTNLLWYAKKAKLKETLIKVNPYPVSPDFSKDLSNERYQFRLRQVDPAGYDRAQIALPISGAAVGTAHALQFIKTLQDISERFEFHVICKEAPYTLFFLHTISGMPYVDLHSSYIDRRIVDLYEEAYEKETIAFEITKPSEQAFKALLNPTQIGGSILLFTKPVGRQEYDNLNFLERHFLIPQESDRRYLYEKAEKKESLEDDERGKKLLAESVRWRGLILPYKANNAAEFVLWAFKQGLFKQMMTCCVVPSPNDPERRELDPHGVEKFWNLVADVLESKSR